MADRAWFLAARRGDAAYIRAHAPQMAGRADEDYPHFTALMYAAGAGSGECVALLAPREARMSTRSGWTALMAAADAGCREAVFALRDAEGGMATTRAYSCYRAGTTALLVAASKGFAQIVEALFSLEAEASGWTRLFYDAFRLDYDGVQLGVRALGLEGGDDVSVSGRNRGGGGRGGPAAPGSGRSGPGLQLAGSLAPDSALSPQRSPGSDMHGRTPLMYVALRGEQAQEVFVPSGPSSGSDARPVSGDSLQGSRNSGTASDRRDPLMDTPPRAGAESPRGHYRVFFSAEEAELTDAERIVRALSPHFGGAVDLQGKTALHYAAEANNSTVAGAIARWAPRELRRRVPGYFPRTALMLAAERGFIDVVLRLAEGESGEASAGGVTALMLACKGGYEECVCALASLEGELRLTGKWDQLSEGAGPVEVAVQHKQLRCARLLRKLCALRAEVQAGGPAGQATASAPASAPAPALSLTSKVSSQPYQPLNAAPSSQVLTQPLASAPESALAASSQCASQFTSQPAPVAAPLTAQQHAQALSASLSAPVPVPDSYLMQPSDLPDTITRIVAEHSETKALLQRYEATHREMLSRLEEARTENSVLNREHEATLSELQQARVRATQLQSELDDRRSEAAASSKRVGELETRLRQVEQQARKFEEQAAQSYAENVELKAALQSLQEERAALLRQSSQCANAREQAEWSLERVRADLRHCEEMLANSRSETARARQEATTLRMQLSRAKLDIGPPESQRRIQAAPPSVPLAARAAISTPFFDSPPAGPPAPPAAAGRQGAGCPSEASSLPPAQSACQEADRVAPTAVSPRRAESGSRARATAAVRSTGVPEPGREGSLPSAPESPAPGDPANPPGDETLKLSSVPQAVELFEAVPAQGSSAAKASPRAPRGSAGSGPGNAFQNSGSPEAERRESTDLRDDIQGDGENRGEGRLAEDFEGGAAAPGPVVIENSIHASMRPTIAPLPRRPRAASSEVCEGRAGRGAVAGSKESASFVDLYNALCSSMSDGDTDSRGGGEERGEAA